ncbi:MAG: hypothetical protein ACUVRO_11100 [Armatimonadota bacterium]
MAYLSEDRKLARAVLRRMEEERDRALGLDRIKNKFLRKAAQFLVPPVNQVVVLPTGALGLKASGAGALAGEDFWHTLFGHLEKLVPEHLALRRGEEEIVGPLYHGTAAALRHPITKEGLRPWTETGRTMWKGTLAPQYPAVYLARSPKTAASYAEHAAKKTGSSPMVVRVRGVQARRLVPDEDLAWVEGLPPEAVRDWRASFALPERVRLAVRGVGDISSLQAPKAVLSGDMPRTSGIGTVGHVGRILPEAIEVVASGSRGKKVFARAVQEEEERLMSLLRAVYKRLKQAGARMSEWL